MTTPEQIQKEYYTRTAVKYDEMHVQHEDQQHYTALKHISLLLGPLGIENILDVGAGTGRAIRYFMDNHPELKVKGIEPVEALVEQAKREGWLPDVPSVTLEWIQLNAQRIAKPRPAAETRQ